jgi:hypothetical protein
VFTQAGPRHVRKRSNPGRKAGSSIATEGMPGVRLADGSRIRWREGEWSVSRRGEVRCAER